MYWSEISMRFSAGRSTPAMRAISLVLPRRRLALALLVAGVGGADDPHDALALDDLALVADLLHRRADLHGRTASDVDPETKSPASASGGTGCGIAARPARPPEMGKSARAALRAGDSRAGPI